MSEAAEVEFEVFGTGEHAITWAGAAPFSPNGFCLGTEDGELVLIESAHQGLGTSVPVSEAREAVNGFAARPGRMAVTTRADVTFLTDLSGGKTGVTSVPCGAHGVVAVEGGFVAALGRNGLLVGADGPQGETKVGFASLPKFRVNVYKLAKLTESAVGFAARSGGFGYFQMHQGRVGAGRIQGAQGMDVVGVCSLAAGSMGLVALTKDAKLLTVRDVSKLEKPRLFGPLTHSVMGAVAYNVLCVRGHVVVLTSKGLHILLDAAAEWATGSAPPSRHYDTPHITIEAVDMERYGPNHILVLTATECLTLDLRQFEGPTRLRGATSEGWSDLSYAGAWQDAAFEQTGELIATA